METLLAEIYGSSTANLIVETASAEAGLTIPVVGHCQKTERATSGSTQAVICTSALDDKLQAELAVNALRGALLDRPVHPSLVHHSDRGVQYCAGDYVDLLHSHGVRISMSRTGNPYDNALAESFMRTLKCEEVYLNTYRDREDALNHIQDFLERIYNCERLHSTLGYQAPAAYEAAAHENILGVPA